ncbi:MAG: hypothetical protein NTW30_00405 [Candidatus Aenigmarchaeota archaeon]|nr:hypothetical protein [Candidatus Aenigmarchaeota archaeon]
MQNIPEYKIATRTIKDVGKDLGRCLLKVSYPITGLLPIRCQEYLHKHFESYNPVNATYVSSITQEIAAMPLFLYGGDLVGGSKIIFNVNQNMALGIPLTLLGAYNIFEPIARCAITTKDKEGIGSMVLKGPLVPARYLYDKRKQAIIELQKELFPTTTI